jgi:hypothetical protein
MNSFIFPNVGITYLHTAEFVWVLTRSQIPTAATIAAANA